MAGLLIGLISAAVTSAPASAAPSNMPGSTATGPDRSCVVDPGDRRLTVDSLQHRCSSEQILELFEAAPVGSAPVGKKAIALLPAFQVRGRLLPYDQARTFTTLQNKLGDSLTFTTAPGGAPWVHKNYVWGADAGGPLTSGGSRIDGKPVFTADFSRDFGGVPISIHEYRQLTPTVWIGRDIGGGRSTTPPQPTGGAFALS
ncbi:hypothetical protein D7316_01288 [Gordonia insulae]|uniref:Secreted protein n=1 Tax=Gordonia insulae TaxID=2420509 RepID=A0A3G8JJI7_9ACTN|nr:hypothetical protein D7316_01288 [Gordonia insulae]